MVCPKLTVQNVMEVVAVQTVNAGGGDKQECTVLGGLNFVKWRLTFQGLQCGTSFVSPIWFQEF